jgi:hypothetical protein
MKLFRRSAPRRASAPLARALAWVLLVPIVYAVTFGTAHTHANVASGLYVSQGSNVIEQTFAAVTEGLGSRSDGYECLVCLFHQQLFNSTVPQTVFVGRAAVEVVHNSTQPNFQYTAPVASSPVTRRFGRAPPFA